MATVQSVGNHVARPFQALGALVAGGHATGDVQVKLAEIPQDVKATPYGEALEKTRTLGRQSADLKAEAVDELLHAHMGAYFRKNRAAHYNDAQQQRVVLPDEKRNVANSAIAGLSDVAEHLIANGLRASSGSGALGNLPSQFTGMLSGGMRSVAA